MGFGGAAAMNILRLIGTLDPSYGGPVEGLRQSVQSLEQLGHSIEIVTLDDPHCPWLGLFPARVHALGPSSGKYRYTTKLIPWLLKHAPHFDAVIVEGIWQYQSLAMWYVSRKLRVPYFVFVHGALDPWFRHQYPLKHLKKWLYWPWAEYRVLRDATAVLFTSITEKELATKSFELYRARGRVVNFGIHDRNDAPERMRTEFLNTYPVLNGKRFILFLGRLHLKKGCDLLIRAFALLVKNDPTLFLVMAGPDSDSWRNSLENLAQDLGISSQIVWTGLIENDLKWGAFYAADVFILPSHSENFGVAVVEALSCSLPVLISNKVNIWREIIEMEAGLSSPNTAEGTYEMMQKWFALPDEVQSQFRVNARQCFIKHFEIMNASKCLVETINETIENIL